MTSLNQSSETDFAFQRGLNEAALAAEKAIEPRIQAQNAIIATLIKTLIDKGALDLDDVSVFLGKLDTSAALFTTFAPDAATALADAALVIRHSLSNKVVKGQ